MIDNAVWIAGALVILAGSIAYGYAWGWSQGWDAGRKLGRAEGYEDAVSRRGHF